MVSINHKLDIKAFKSMKVETKLASSFVRERYKTLKISVSVLGGEIKYILHTNESVKDGFLNLEEAIAEYNAYVV